MNRGCLSGYQPVDQNAEAFSAQLVAPQAGASIVISYNQSRNYYLTNPGAVTVTVRDWPPAGQLAILTIEWTPQSATAPTWPSTWKWLTDSNAAPTATTGKRKLITAYTRDGGATVLASATQAEA